MTAGRPLKFESVELLEAAIEEYFASCWEEVWKERRKLELDSISGKMLPVKDERGEFEMEWYQCFDRQGNALLRMIRPYTITGLAVALNTSRRTLIDYEEREEYTHTIKKAKDRCEEYAEEGMFTGTVPAIPGIFNLKNNYGWTDKTEVDVTAKVTEMAKIKRDGKTVDFDVPDSAKVGDEPAT